mgnify:CR=1 FL=1
MVEQEIDYSAVVDILEDILGESEYVVRYERGNFQSGWCLLESKRIVVLNKFLNLLLCTHECKNRMLVFFRTQLVH